MRVLGNVTYQTKTTGKDKEVSSLYLRTFISELPNGKFIRYQVSLLQLMQRIALIHEGLSINSTTLWRYSVSGLSNFVSRLSMFPSFIKMPQVNGTIISRNPFEPLFFGNCMKKKGKLQHSETGVGFWAVELYRAINSQPNKKMGREEKSNFTKGRTRRIRKAILSIKSRFPNNAFRDYLASYETAEMGILDLQQVLTLMIKLKPRNFEVAYPSLVSLSRGQMVSEETTLSSFVEVKLRSFTFEGLIIAYGALALEDSFLVQKCLGLESLPNRSTMYHVQASRFRVSVLFS